MSARRAGALLSRLELFGVRLGLGRIRSLLATFDDPHLSVPIVLVGGTNGKGSTAALLAAMGRAAGYRTGLYTSPHLEAVTERLSIDGSAISDQRLVKYLETELEQARDLGDEPPTSFEALTTAAFAFFRDAEVDLAVMEVGLGGRLDATNVCQPILSLITSIGLDHEALLGQTLESIAGEKSGILRRDRPAVAWAGTPLVTQTLEKNARHSGALLELADRTSISTVTPPEACPQQVQIRTARHAYTLELHLAGAHQLRNLAVAVRAAEVLAEGDWPAFDSVAITSGVASCRWPGRLEWIVLDDGRRVLLDAAHNAAGMEALVGFLDLTGERPDLLFGALTEKSIEAQLPELAARVRGIILTQPASERSADPKHWLPHFPGRPTRIEADPRQALALALESTESTLLVCGSIYLVGIIRGLLRHRAKTSWELSAPRAQTDGLWSPLPPGEG